MTVLTIIAEWPKNSRETVRVSLDQYQGRDTIDIRSWWTDAAGELKPGKSGITLAVRHLPDLANAIAQALAEAKSRGLGHNQHGSCSRYLVVQGGNNAFPLENELLLTIKG